MNESSTNPHLLSLYIDYIHRCDPLWPSCPSSSSKMRRLELVESSSTKKASSTGWWFGCHQFYFPINIGFRLSSQMTNSYFSEGWLKTTNQSRCDAPDHLSLLCLLFLVLHPPRGRGPSMTHVQVLGMLKGISDAIKRRSKEPKC